MYPFLINLGKKGIRDHPPGIQPRASPRSPAATCANSCGLSFPPPADTSTTDGGGRAGQDPWPPFTRNHTRKEKSQQLWKQMSANGETDEKDDATSLRGPQGYNIWPIYLEATKVSPNPTSSCPQGPSPQPKAQIPLLVTS